jgi:hypothetical protein
VAHIQRALDATLWPLLGWRLPYEPGHARIDRARRVRDGDVSSFQFPSLLSPVSRGVAHHRSGPASVAVFCRAGRPGKSEGARTKPGRVVSRSDRGLVLALRPFHPSPPHPGGDSAPPLYVAFVQLHEHGRLGEGGPGRPCRPEADELVLESGPPPSVVHAVEYPRPESLRDKAGRRRVQGQGTGPGM